MAENMDMETDSRPENQVNLPVNVELSQNISALERMQVSADHNLPSTSSASGSNSSGFAGQSLSQPPASKTTIVQSDHSEFDSDDDQDDFDLWSSDSSCQISDDESKVDDKADADVETQTGKRRKKAAQDQWNQIDEQKIHKFEFSGNSQLTNINIKETITPLHCFNLFVDDDIINLLVTETNKFARSKFIRPGYHKDFLTGWMDVTPTEMREFIGLLIFMNLKAFRASLGSKYFWSGDRNTRGPIAGYVMTETRFKRLITFWRFGEEQGKFSKINVLLRMLNANFAKYKTPGRVLFVGKSTLYLRQRYIFQKLADSPKRAQIILKLVDNETYIYKVVAMPPTYLTDDGKKKQAVLELLKDYLNQGRMVIFDDLFISVDIAQNLVSRKTHVVGPIRKKSKSIPEKVKKLKLQNNEVKGFQNPQGISIFKWKTDDFRGCGLSSCHSYNTVEVEELNRREGNVTVTKKQSEFLKDFSSSADVFEMVENSHHKEIH
ncbi:piggyBac transposable element-derived protein 2-like [Sitophilus oryzae]|uniref:PiggyBac transposable element-derived protein 2-like n=1 Tax=Sitophilus oryzae TaxID=7048 RepID=A0A6J2Y222_SITOR|nr:piggyBac transposable element-derived protein 2-like [Sitophilus oryzae]